MSHGPSAPPTVAAQEHRAWALGLVCQQILAVRPSSVLDVGCGRGRLVLDLRWRGVRAWGLDPGTRGDADGRTPHEPFAGAGPVLCARAASLPLRDRSVDWLVLRHVAHHLARPERALAELARVARVGVLMAEPWHPTDTPSREIGARIESFLRAHDRRHGMRHDPDLPPERLLAGLGDGTRWDARIAFQHPGWLLAPDELRVALDDAVRDLPEAHEARCEATTLADRARATGVAAPGTVLVVARRVG